MNVYSYIVDVYNVVSEDINTEKGILTSKNFTSATKKLEDYYGADNIESLQICIESPETDVIELSDETFSAVKEELQKY